jgi:hypothetical protein
LTLSVAAFSLSCVSAYFSTLQTTDNLSAVLVGFPPAFGFVSPDKLEIAPAEFQLWFINGGNRPAMISSFEVEIKQYHNDEVIKHGYQCYDSRSINHDGRLETDFAPIILKEKDAQFKEVKLKPNDDGTKRFYTYKPLKDEYSSQVVWCFTFAVSTVSEDFDSSVVVSKFIYSNSDEPDHYNQTGYSGFIKRVPIHFGRGTVFSN